MTMKPVKTKTKKQTKAKFPVTYSSLDTKALLKLAADKWGATPGSTITFLKRGFNDTYLITEPSGEKFILRIYNNKWRSQKGIESELLTLLMIPQFAKVSVPGIILNKEIYWWEVILAPEGERLAVMFDYAPGTAVRRLSVKQAHTLGVETAKLHVLFKEIAFSFTDYNYDIENQFNNTLYTLKPILVNFPEQFNYLEELKKDFIKTFEEADKNELNYGLCHGDLQAENIHFTDKNKITFFDFDLMGKGYQAYDIGVFLWYDHKNKTPEIVKSFMEGYETKRKLSDTEHRLLPYFSTLRAVFQMTLFCKTNDGHHLPKWPDEEVAAFVNKIKSWHEKKNKTY